MCHLLLLVCSFDVNVRGDIARQMDVAVDAAVQEGRLDAATDKGPVKHTWWWRLGHVSGNARARTHTHTLLGSVTCLHDSAVLRLGAQCAGVRPVTRIAAVRWLLQVKKGDGQDTAAATAMAEARVPMVTRVA